MRPIHTGRCLNCDHTVRTDGEPDEAVKCDNCSCYFLVEDMIDYYEKTTDVPSTVDGYIIEC